MIAWNKDDKKFFVIKLYQLHADKHYDIVIIIAKFIRKARNTLLESNQIHSA